VLAPVEGGQVGGDAELQIHHVAGEVAAVPLQPAIARQDLAAHVQEVKAVIDRDAADAQFEIHGAQSVGGWVVGAYPARGSVGGRTGAQAGGKHDRGEKYGMAKRGFESAVPAVVLHGDPLLGKGRKSLVAP